jgi:hypothetical protein
MMSLLQAALAICMLLQATPPFARTQSGPYLIEYPPDRPGLARSIVQQLQSARPLPGLPAGAPAFGATIRIILPRSDAQFDSVTGGIIPEWGAGVAAPQEGIIVIPGYSGGRAANSDRARVLRHELAHIALHRYLSPARIPRWFNEGYATWAAGELDLAGEWRLRLAFATRSAPPLDSIELSFPRATQDAEVAYLLSASVVSYLVRASGVRGLELFLQRWHESHNMEQALGATYGMSLDQLETYWIRDVRSRYGWLAVLTQGAIIMAGASILMIALYLWKRRRNRQKLALLRATEPPDEPAFWEEPGPAVDDVDQKGQF